MVPLLPDDARRAFDESLKVLGFDYLDLFLIHWLNRNERTGPDPDTFDAI